MIRKLFQIMIITVALSSCLSIENQLSLQNDGSGNLIITYRISRALADLGNFEETSRNLPLPVKKEDFERVIKNQDGIRLDSYTFNETDKTITVIANISFKKVELLSVLDDSSPEEISFKIDGENHLFTRDLPYSAEPISDDSLKMIEEFLVDQYLLYTITVPSQIKEYSLGELAGDKKNLTYKISLMDLLKTKYKKILNIKW